MKAALILIDHGSKRDAANVMLEEVVERARERGLFDIVEAAHMELAEPTLEQAFASCVEQGAERVVVHPYFLSPGRHSQSDIPRMTRAVAARFQRVETFLTEPLGVDDRLIDLVFSRADESVAQGRRVGVDRTEAAAS